MNDKPKDFKLARTALADMQTNDSNKITNELEAMAEILYAMEEEDCYDPLIKVMAACMADIATVIATQYMTSKPGEKP